ncbi:MAG: hypothetical protein DRO11_10395 [Methanobacteriota archaeon]|nr:MAG: hypothetical protein DRO11_10395 [Euryarchaeota archaeon]
MNVEYRLVGSVYEVSNDGGEWHEFAVVEDGEIVITDYTYITYSHDYPVVYESNPELFEVEEYPDEGVVEIYPLVLPSGVPQEGYVEFEDGHVTELEILPETS